MGKNHIESNIYSKIYLEVIFMIIGIGTDIIEINRIRKAPLYNRSANINTNIKINV